MTHEAAKAAALAQFKNEAELIAFVDEVEGLRLPKKAWTHEAHFYVGLRVLRRDGKAGADRYLPGKIWRYNFSNGTANTDSGGYHETLTRFYIEVLWHVLQSLPASLPLNEIAKRIILSPLGDRDLPLNYWTKEKLFSVEARRVWVDPDKKAFDFKTLPL